MMMQGWGGGEGRALAGRSGVQAGEPSGCVGYETLRPPARPRKGQLPCCAPQLPTAPETHGGSLPSPPHPTPPYSDCHCVYSSCTPTHPAPPAPSRSRRRPLCCACATQRPCRRSPCRRRRPLRCLGPVCFCSLRCFCRCLTPGAPACWATPPPTPFTRTPPAAASPPWSATPWRPTTQRERAPRSCCLPPLLAAAPAATAASNSLAVSACPPCFSSPLTPPLCHSPPALGPAPPRLPAPWHA